MFCRYCGKEIEDNAGFCPHCGKKVSGSDVETVQNALKKAAGTVASSAKVVSGAVNEAMDGKMGAAAESVKQTTKEFAGDIKQAAADKDMNNFFKKNKYRNVKILVVICIGVFILSKLFGSSSDSSSSKYRDAFVVETVKENVVKPAENYYNDIAVSDVTIEDKDKYGRYLVSATVTGENANGGSDTFYCAMVVIMSENITEDVIKNLNYAEVGAGDVQISEPISFSLDEKKEKLNEMKKTYGFGEKLSDN